MNWNDIQIAAFGNEYKDDEPKMCVVSARYGGCYEGGQFVAIPIDDLGSAAFGEDCAAAAWWDKHRPEVGVGHTPDEALSDWFSKRCRKVLA